PDEDSGGAAESDGNGAAADGNSGHASAAGDFDEEFEDSGASSNSASHHGSNRYAQGVGHAEGLSVGDVDPATGLEVVEASGEDAWQLTGRGCRAASVPVIAIVCPADSDRVVT